VRGSGSVLVWASELGSAMASASASASESVSDWGWGLALVWATERELATELA
jgi:hypothetical protein